MEGLHIVGHRGRIGSELSRLARRAGVALVDKAEQARVVALAVPWRVAGELLARGYGARTVIDLSGALKLSGQGCYALLDTEDRLLDGRLPQSEKLLANPGCIAASVIVGLRRVGLAGRLGAIQVSAVGGASMAGRRQSGQLRLGRRLLDHPHVREIEQALPGARVESFAPMVSYAQPRGILTVISGRLLPGRVPPIPPAAQGDQLDVAAVVGTPELRCRLVLGPEADAPTFTLGVVLDNLSFPAANALRLAQRILGS